MKQIFFSILMVVIISGSLFSSSLKVHLEKIYEIGNKEDVFFGEISSIAQDKDGNLFVADIKRYSISKFSPEGKYLFSFGKKGEGPGDFKFKFNVAISNQNQVVVGEAFPYISFFGTDGKFLKKHNLRQSGLSRVFFLRYISDNVYLAKKYNKKNASYVLLSLQPEAKIINDHLIEGTELKSYKEFAMNDKLISPELFFAFSGKYAAVSDNYNYLIKIVDGKGNVTNTIKRNIEKPDFTKKEREYLIDKLVLADKSLGPALKKGIINNLIPYKKCLIMSLAISNTHVFVERVRVDITKEDSTVPIDIFRIDGTFLGQIQLPSLPLLITDKFFYFVEKNHDDDDILITKYTYHF